MGDVHKEQKGGVSVKPYKTAKDRAILYRRAIKIIGFTKCEYICHAIGELLYGADWRYFDDVDLRMFPELYKQRPTDADYAWWPPWEYAIRKKALLLAAEEAENKSKEDK
jgi:hypothetical protein